MKNAVFGDLTYDYLWKEKVKIKYRCSKRCFVVIKIAIIRKASVFNKSIGLFLKVINIRD